MINHKYFGTDGIRGKIGTIPITKNFILKLGLAAGTVLLNKNYSRNIIIGTDTRSSSYILESCIASGLSASGFSVIFVGILPTPAVSYLSKLLSCFGVMISASHNTFEFNGVKFFSVDGSKLSDIIEREIELELENTSNYITHQTMSYFSTISNASRIYINFCKKNFTKTIKSCRFKIVIDYANGATYNIANKLFYELGATVINIFNIPNGKNINKFCGSTNLYFLKKKLYQNKQILD
ncbi:hypothetical protein [Buchnera aphidicola]|uniref:hypothetical protein n=1 Tax=Buchnera aphidicola TaxID=9 RepID=UPI003463C5E3